MNHSSKRGSAETREVEEEAAEEEQVATVAARYLTRSMFEVRLTCKHTSH